MCFAVAISEQRNEKGPERASMRCAEWRSAPSAETAPTPTQRPPGFPWTRAPDTPGKPCGVHAGAATGDAAKGGAAQRQPNVGQLALSHTHTQKRDRYCFLLQDQYSKRKRGWWCGNHIVTYFFFSPTPFKDRNCPPNFGGRGRGGSFDERHLNMMA